MNRKNRRQQLKKAPSVSGRAPAITASAQTGIIPLLVQANAAFKSGNQQVAESLLQDALKMAPTHPDALNLKAVFLMNQGNVAGAVRLLRKITTLAPNFAQAHFNLGTALNALGKQKPAIRALSRAIDIEPDHADAHFNLGNALRQSGHIDTAITHYNKTLEISPDHSAAATNLASAHLETNNPSAALSAGQLALQADPGNRDAISFCAIAAVEAGDPGRAAELLNPQLLVRPRQFSSGDGIGDLDAFNAALAAHVLAHPTLAREPHNKATRNGQQTDNLALGERGPVAQLQAMIGTALDDYLQVIGGGNTHPYPPLIPPLSQIDIWGTVLGAQGHQTAHMHRAAWVSGVYYVKLPDVMSAGGDDHAGWIEFCRPPDQFNCQTAHPVHLIEPKEGLLVLFPSFMYHRTIPFDSEQTRISIAFDLLA
ncbi:MAG: tetratricopeptide repeat protein [Rhodospirillales bacterium]|nr:tetratricopeptide repeat protein [Rhodospirillales bacterium]